MTPSPEAHLPMGADLLDTIIPEGRSAQSRDFGTEVTHDHVPVIGGQSRSDAGDGLPPLFAQQATASRGKSSHDSERRTLLQQRLEAIFPIGFVIWATIFGLWYAEVDPIYRREVLGPNQLIVLFCAVLVWGAGTALIWVRRSWSLRWLLGFEGVCFIIHVGGLLVVRVGQDVFSLSVDAADPRGDDLVLCAAALHNSFGWLAAIIAWGFVFPHPWKHMLVIVIGLAACPLLLDLGFILLKPAHFVLMSFPLVVSAEMVATGAVLAIFGSQRLQALQEEVADARREAREMGAYTLIRKLGAGGMGEVYLAEHRLLKRPCAVKLIRPERTGDSQSLSRFEREVQATAQLRSPNVVEVYDYGRTDDGTFYYVMEYLDGLSLEEAVTRRGPLAVPHVIHILRQVCGALREAHEQGLIHRDIKPSNILICRQGTRVDVVKLVDFGLVQQMVGGPDASKSTLTATMTGTPHYMSPEQADGSAVDARSDLYSLGTTAFFLLTGKPPFTGKTMLDVLFAHRQQSIPDLLSPSGQIPAELQALVRRCLAKSPDDRVPSALGLEKELQQHAESAPWSEADSSAWWTSFV